MRRPIIVVSCLVCLLAGATVATLVGPSGAPVRPTYNEPGASQLAERQINTFRQQRGLRPLRPSTRLRASANAYADRLAHGARFQHLDRLPIPDAFRTAGEVLGYSPDASPRAAVRAWVLSPAHRAVLLSPEFGWFGVGQSRHGLRYFWVGHFGRL